MSRSTIPLQILILSALLAGAGEALGRSFEEQPPAPAPPSRLTVQASDRCEPRRPECSITAALQALADGGTLELAPGRYPANLVLTRDVTIEGVGMGRTILDGGGAGRVLRIESGARVTVRGVTLTGGRLDKELERDGGGVWNEGVLKLERCEVTGNVAVDDGGGIRNDGKLTLSQTAVQDNRATRWGSVGGGIYNPVIFATPELEIVASTISGNVAGDNGGGIWCEGSVTLIDSTVSGNSAAHTGGGIRNNGNLTVVNSTIAFNHAGTTGGGLRSFGVATLSNTILAANSAGESGADCQGPLASRGHNLVMKREDCEITGGKGDLLGIDPKLEPLADNGGSTLTHALPAESPAVDAGDPSPVGSGESACDASDQRSRRRPLDGNGDGKPICDIGAVEREPAGPTAGGRG